MYVIYQIYRHQRGTDFKLINIDTLESCGTTSIKPIHPYYDNTTSNIVHLTTKLWSLRLELMENNIPCLQLYRAFSAYR